MSVLESRLRLGRRQRQELLRYLAGLEALAERLRLDERRLRAEIPLGGAEGLSPEPAAGLPFFAEEPANQTPESPVERHGKLARSIAAIDTQIVEVGAALAAAEQGVRRHELAAAQRTPDQRTRPEPIRRNRSSN